MGDGRPASSFLFSDPDAFLLWFLRDGRSTLIDETGRSLGEHTHMHRDDVDPAELAPPHFGDVRDRYGLPYNRAAFAQVGRHWRWVVPALWRLAEERGHAGRTATAYDAYVVANDAYHLAIAHALRRDAAPLLVPERYAGLHKIALGYTILFAEGLLDGTTPADAPADPWEADGFLRFLDDGAWLVGLHECCAGPLDMIRTGFEALVHPRATEDTEGSTLPGESELARTVADRARELFALSVVAVSGARVFLQWGAGWGEGGGTPEASAAEPVTATLGRPGACRAAIWCHKHSRTDPRQALRLYPAGEAPESLRDFVGELDAIECPLDLDRRFLAHARPVVNELLAKLGRVSETGV